MKRILVLLMALAVTATIAACGGGESTTPGQGSGDGGATAAGETAAAAIEPGGTFRLGTTSETDSPNPFVAFSALSYVLFTNTYPTLVQYDESYQFVGDWAESWETSADGKVWTFKVKPGEWSDGTPLTAKDAAFTGNLIIKYADGPAGALAPYLTHATSVEAPDNSTVVITYDKAVANVLPQIQAFYILPQHVLEPLVGDKGKGLKKWDPTKGGQVGGGSFFMKEYDEKGTIILERNPGYYGTAPIVDRVGLTVYQNPDAMLAALDGGQLDAIDSVPPTLAQQYESNPKYQVQIGDSTLVYDIGFNSNPDKPKNRELLDPKVREALAMGVDRQKIIDVVLNGYGAPAATMFTPLSGEYLNTDIQPEPFDIAAGNAILDELGYAMGPDGVRTKPAGGRMEYAVILPDSVEGMDRLFEIVQDGWGQMGVSVTANKMDATAAFEAIGAPDWKYLNYDIMIWNWVGYIDPDFMLSVVTCGQYGSWSDTGYCNPAYDRMYLEQGVTLDPAARKDIIWEMQDILYRDKPYIQVARKQSIVAYTDQWTNLTDPFLTGLTKIPWEVIARKAS
jgi:peptide/nickel transport system substrate-binding protein